MIKRNSFLVLCPSCEDTVGQVTEVEDTKRPGFFANVSIPAEIPGRCPTCDSFLARIPNYN